MSKHGSPVYETREIEDQIKVGLIGEPVEARLMIRQPVPGTSIEFDRYDLVLMEIKRGPTEESILGKSLLDDTLDDE